MGETGIIISSTPFFVFSNCVLNYLTRDSHRSRLDVQTGDVVFFVYFSEISAKT